MPLHVQLQPSPSSVLLAPTCDSHEQKLVARGGEGEGGACAPEIVISLPVNHLRNDTEKHTVLGPFGGLRGILPPIQTK